MGSKCLDWLSPRSSDFFPLLFYRTLRYARKSEHSGCAAKSSVLGLRGGAPLLKTDRFGDPSASLRWPSFQFAALLPQTSTKSKRKDKSLPPFRLCRSFSEGTQRRRNGRLGLRASSFSWDWTHSKHKVHLVSQGSAFFVFHSH